MTAIAMAQVPRGWGFDSPTQAYAGASDHTIVRTGRASGTLRSVGEVGPASWAVLNQKVSAARFRGLRLRLTGYLRTQGVTGRAGLWLRLDSAQATTLEFDNMAAQPVLN